MAINDPQILVSTAWLADHLSDPDLRVLDASMYLPGVDRCAKAEYDAAHIPGARFFDIDDISDGYGVVRIEEAIKIRKFSDKKILLMQGVYTDADYELARENKLDLVVHNNDQFSLIRKHNNFNNLWLKVNTGMNRLGLKIYEFEETIYF